MAAPYCSAICCMYATKEAAITKEADPGIDVTIFYMDIRAYGKDFQQYYEKAKASGVEYVRGRPSSVFENPDGSITVRYMDTHTREVKERTVDLLVLSTAIIPSKENSRLARVLGIGVDGSGFFETGSIMEDPMRSTRPGVFLAGCDQGPKDIPDSVAMASGAAAKAMAAVVGREKAAPAPLPQERQVAGETPGIGVFVCHCGKNIHGFLDTEEVAAYARGLPHVEFATDVMFACSEDTIKSIRDQVSEKGLNRVIVAACSPVTHAGLFQDTMVEAGLNKYLFEFANIRQHCSWVHSRDRRTATDKAKALVRMAVRKSSLLEPLAQEEVPVTPAVLIVGGGLAGMRTALALADMRVRSFIVEREPELGGILRRLHSLFPLDLMAEDVVAPLADRAWKSEYVEVLTGSTLESVEGFIGNFEAKVSTPRGERRIKFGTAVIASGFREVDLTGRYGYGSSHRVMTEAGLEERLKAGDLPPLKSVVFINCAGAMEPERPWCCRVGCGVSIKNARLLKELDPGADVHILYRDIRVFGKDEEEYFTDVIENERVKIVRYSLERPPDVAVDGDNVTVRVHDEIYGDDLEIPADLVVLTAQTEGSDTAGALMDMFKVPAGPGRFLIEAHAKIRPLDFATDGVYFCGSAHYPKNLADTIAQAEGAASRAAIPIMKGRLVLEGITASVDRDMCVGCGLCVAACPYAAIELKDGKASVNNALCKGCGLCAATCRSGAVQQRGFNDLQIISMIRGALHEVM